MGRRGRKKKATVASSRVSSEKLERASKWVGIAGGVVTLLEKLVEGIKWLYRQITIRPVLMSVPTALVIVVAAAIHHPSPVLQDAPSAQATTTDADLVLGAPSISTQEIPKAATPKPHIPERQSDVSTAHSTVAARATDTGLLVDAQDEEIDSQSQPKFYKLRIDEDGAVTCGVQVSRGAVAFSLYPDAPVIDVARPLRRFTADESQQVVLKVDLEAGDYSLRAVSLGEEKNTFTLRVAFDRREPAGPEY